MFVLIYVDFQFYLELFHQTKVEFLICMYELVQILICDVLHLLTLSYLAVT